MSLVAERKKLHHHYYHHQQQQNWKIELKLSGPIRRWRQYFRIVSTLCPEKVPLYFPT